MEILSPAGNFESLVAAVQNGANAVYVGGSDFSARKSAKNFDDYELEKAIDYCHLRNAKLYVACNTLIKEKELLPVAHFLEKIYKMGADAVIVQDLAILKMMKDYLPHIPAHASTQMTISNSFGVNLLEEKYNVKRVVLSRELSFDEIGEIRKNTKTELEVFVHGALCMSYSGQCLFSSIVGGRSGNRGACAQPCRLLYSLYEENKKIAQEKSILSPKDLCLIDEIEKLSKIGVNSLKIEGRMKSPEYVAMATRVYSQALSKKADRKEIEKMLQLFSRGGAEKGYFYGRQFDKMMSYDSDAKISADRETKKEAKNSFSGENIKRKVNMFFECKLSEPIRLIAECQNEYSAAVLGEVAQKANEKPLDSERIKAQLEKLGSTVFEADFTEVITDGCGTVAIKDINELRRRAVAELENQIIKAKKRTDAKIEIKKYETSKSKETKINVEVTTKEQYLALKDIDGINLFVPYNVLKEIKENGAVCVLPAVLKDTDSVCLDEFDKVEINNISQLAKAYGKEIYGGYSLNLYNSSAVNSISDEGVKCVCLSSELTETEISECSENIKIPFEIMVYGRHRLMYIENCIIKSNGRCACHEKNFFLKDRTGALMPIISQNCRNIILNSRPIYMADKQNTIKKLAPSAIRLVFTTEKPEECRIIIDEYKKALRGEKISFVPKNYTRGHFFRGAK